MVDRPVPPPIATTRNGEADGVAAAMGASISKRGCSIEEENEAGVLTESQLSRNLSLKAEVQLL